MQNQVLGLLQNSAKEPETNTEAKLTTAVTFWKSHSSENIFICHTFSLPKASQIWGEGANGTLIGG